MEEGWVWSAKCPRESVQLQGLVQIKASIHSTVVIRLANPSGKALKEVDLRALLVALLDILASHTRLHPNLQRVLLHKWVPEGTLTLWWMESWWHQVIHPWEPRKTLLTNKFTFRTQQSVKLKRTAADILIETSCKAADNYFSIGKTGNDCIISHKWQIHLLLYTSTICVVCYDNCVIMSTTRHNPPTIYEEEKTANII